MILNTRQAVLFVAFNVLAIAVTCAQDLGTNRPGNSHTLMDTQASPELSAIRAQSEAFIDSFNKKDAKTLAALWTQDCEYVDEVGEVYSGREAIEKAYAQLFAESPEAKIQISIESLRMLSPNAATEDGQAVVELTPNGVSNVSNYTAVHVKVDGKWLMATVRESPDPTQVPRQNAADLEWLVGTWLAEEHGVKTESDIHWVVDGRFLERRYTTTQLDGTQTTGVQLIGWNPQEGYVQSWDFSPDGGHAEGVWTAIEGGWQAEIHGTTGDGLPTAATNVLGRLDDNAYVWQSVQRSLGGEALPDTDEVVIKRTSNRSAQTQSPDSP